VTASVWIGWEIKRRAENRTINLEFFFSDDLLKRGVLKVSKVKI
jgi:hypothetical protein